MACINPFTAWLGGLAASAFALSVGARRWARSIRPVVRESSLQGAFTTVALRAPTSR
jgi:hypothetical protein